jgi:hypothetical protein
MNLYYVKYGKGGTYHHEISHQLYQQFMTAYNVYHLCFSVEITKLIIKLKISPAQYTYTCKFLNYQDRVLEIN